MKGSLRQRRRVLGWTWQLVRAGGWTLLAGGVLGALLQWTFRDSWGWLAPVHYVLPWPAVAGLLALGWLLAWPRRSGAIFAGCLLGVSLWQGGSSFWRPEAPEGDAGSRPLLVFFWNAYSFQSGVEATAGEIMPYAPDVIALVEANLYFPEERAKLQQALPGYALETFAGGILVAVRGTFVGTWEGSLGDDEGHYALIEASIEGEDVDVLVVDIPSDPLDSREGPLTAVAELTEILPMSELVLVGDFNTPATSVFFDRLEETMRPAFDRGGRGWRGTWPARLPLLDLDQAWVSPGLEVQEVRNVRVQYSDHWAVVLRYEGGRP